MPAVAVNAEPARDETDRLLDALEPILAKYRDSYEHRQHLAFIKALRLAGPRLDVFEALMRGEKVPRSSMDPDWLKAYGL